MDEPPSSTVVAADEQDEIAIDLARWSELARAVLTDEARHGELTLTFVDRDEIAALNREHMGKDAPTDVLSFPLDEDTTPGVPVLLGDVVVCPSVAAEQASSHTGTLDDELALLVVHGILHVVGHDHAETDDASEMRARELEHMRRHHWRGPVPDGFRQEHDEGEGSPLMLGAEFTTNDALISAFLLVLFVLLALLGVAETGINRITRHKAESLAHEHPVRGRALERLVEQPEKFLNPILLTVNILQTATASLSTFLFTRLLGTWGAVLGFVLNVVVLFVFTEAIPKTWAVLHSEQAALVTARPTSWLVRFWPLRVITQGLIGLSNWILPGKGIKGGPFVSERELLGIVAEAAQDEVIEHEERELIESIIEFGDTVAREVMVPRPDMIIVPEDATISAALDLAIEHGVSRLPLHGPDGDDIVGLLYTKDLIGAERAGRGADVVTDLCRPVRFIPENKPVARLMREMQAGKFHLAIVADEYGGIAGLITLEDCLEELVGEIVDEYDVEELSIQQLPGGDYLVEGGVQVEELNDVLDADLPDEEWDTVGGLLFGTLEHVPEPGESVELDGWRFTAEELDGRRIRSVRVSAVSVADGAGTDGADA